VDELVEKAKQRDPSIGAATVYRTMKILADAGLASARHFEGGQTRYEAALDRHHHDHLICTSCGNIVEFENERIEELQDRVARSTVSRSCTTSSSCTAFAPSAKQRQSTPKPAALVPHQRERERRCPARFN